MSSVLILNQNLDCISLNTGNITCGTMTYTNITSGTLATTRSTMPNVRYTNVTTGTLITTSVSAANIASTNSSMSTLALSNALITIPTSTTYYSEFVSTVNISDGTNATLFTVTTTNETGASDAGGYTLRISGYVVHNGGSTFAGTTAAKAFEVFYSRAMEGSGTGVNRTTQYSIESSSVNSAGRGVGGITYSMAEVSEYVVNMVFNVNLTGTNIAAATIIAHVSMASNGFITPPTIS